MSHFPQNHIHMLWIQQFWGKCKIRKANPLMICSTGAEHYYFVTINLLVILMQGPLMRSLYFSGMISGEVASNHFVSAEQHKDSWHAQLKLSICEYFVPSNAAHRRCWEEIYTCFSPCITLNELPHSMPAYWTTDYGCGRSVRFTINRLNIQRKCSTSSEAPRSLHRYELYTRLEHII